MFGGFIGKEPTAKIVSGYLFSEIVKQFAKNNNE
jgi:hypothetical protein